MGSRATWAVVRRGPETGHLAMWTRPCRLSVPTLPERHARGRVRPPTPERHVSMGRTEPRPLDHPVAKRSRPRRTAGEVLDLSARSPHCTAFPACSTPHRLLPGGCAQSLRFVAPSWRRPFRSPASPSVAAASGQCSSRKSNRESNAPRTSTDAGGRLRTSPLLRALVADLVDPPRTHQRNGRDSNPRGLRPAAFKAAAFVHSATVPVPRLPGYTPGLPGEVPERPNGAPCSQERCQSGRMGRPAKALIAAM